MIFTPVSCDRQTAAILLESPSDESLDRHTAWHVPRPILAPRRKAAIVFDGTISVRSQPAMPESTVRELMRCD
jgi:hypothetical protein